MENKIIFMGTPSFAGEILSELIKHKYHIDLVVTQPDKPFGRKKQLKTSAVKDVAILNNIEVFQPLNIKNDYQRIIELEPDLIITAAYGQIVPIEVLNAPKIECINMHGSLLPKYRGGAPIQYALLNGEKETGITIMKMVQKMDAGAIIFQKKVSISDDDNTETLFNKMTECAKELLIESIDDILSKNYQLIEQDESEVIFSPTIKKEDERIDFNQKVYDVYNKIRALAPNPCGYFIVDNIRYKILKASYNNESSITNMIMKITQDTIEIGTQDGNIIIHEIQAEGKKALSVKQYLNGNPKLQENQMCEEL